MKTLKSSLLVLLATVFGVTLWVASPGTVQAAPKAEKKVTHATAKPAHARKAKSNHHARHHGKTVKQPVNPAPAQ